MDYWEVNAGLCILGIIGNSMLGFIIFYYLRIIWLFLIPVSILLLILFIGSIHSPSQLRILVVVKTNKKHNNII